MCWRCEARLRVMARPLTYKVPRCSLAVMTTVLMHCAEPQNVAVARETGCKVKQGSRFRESTVFMRLRGCHLRRQVFEFAVSHDPHKATSTGWQARSFTQKLELLLLRRASPRSPDRSDLPGLFPSAEEPIAAVRLKP
jgi:hypothetical protein